MADVTAAIRDHLEADASVAAVVGTRVRRVSARTSDTKPYIVITEIEDDPVQHINGGSDKAEAFVQIDCISDSSRGQARALSDLVFASLNGRVPAAMGDDNLVVSSVFMDRRRPLDTEPTDGTQNWIFKDICEFTVGYAQDETP